MTTTDVLQNPAAPGEIDPERRRFLIGATSVVGAAAVVGAAVPFVASWQPSAKARAAGGPVRIDVGKLGPGEILGPIPEWRGQPIFVVHRTPPMLAALEATDVVLVDPLSERASQQPAYAANPWRSRAEHRAFVVLVGICTHLGCSPKYYGEVGPQPFEANWQGGFFCPCHGSKFDLAGRVYTGVPAPSNLVVPPHMFESDAVLVVGMDEEGQA
ncbi:MAG: ubiquinol-cytochrome c reductase iron-sulfur subunit [Pseudomonadales bacterium]|jgi:ubiquinol-cytochrome c reductase iron-sulfur subunit|nr:ubiquinol-cytochrome c reductase iron-sulfur subunit [Pseudomonadales bacterium]